MWGMGSNPWVQEPAPPEPVGDGEEALRVDYRRWAAGAEVTASRRLGHVSAGGDGSVGRRGSWWVGRLDVGGSAGCGGRGPVVAGAGRVRGRGAGGGDGAHLCRRLGGRSGRGRGVGRGGVPGGRAGGAAAGGGRSRQTPQGSSQARPRCVGAFPLVLGVPWQPAWRLTRPGEAPRSLRVLRITKTINNSGRKNS